MSLYPLLEVFIVEGEVSEHISDVCIKTAKQKPGSKGLPYSFIIFFIPLFSLWSLEKTLTKSFQSYVNGKTDIFYLIPFDVMKKLLKFGNPVTFVVLISASEPSKDFRDQSR